MYITLDLILLICHLMVLNETPCVLLTLQDTVAICNCHVWGVKVRSVELRRETSRRGLAMLDIVIDNHLQCQYHDNIE